MKHLPGSLAPMIADAAEPRPDTEGELSNDDSFEAQDKRRLSNDERVGTKAPFQGKLRHRGTKRGEWISNLRFQRTNTRRTEMIAR
jgi:hypothetical protein